MPNTKDEVRVSKNFVNLIKENEGLFYKTLNRLFDIDNFSEICKFSPDDIKLEEPFDNFGRMDILIENHNYFLIIENKVHNPTEAQKTQTTSYFRLMENKEKEGKKTFICYLINNGHPTKEFNSAVKKHSNAKIDYWNDLVTYLYKTADSSEKKNIEFFILYSRDEIDNFEVDIDSKEKVFEFEADLLANPFLLSAIDNNFYDSDLDTRILETLVIPALKSIENINNVHIDKDTFDYVVFNYYKEEYWLNLTMFYNPQFQEWSYKNSFTFYRPWIIGCHEATSEEQMIKYTKDAIIMWLNDCSAQSEIIREEDLENFEQKEKCFGQDVEIFSDPWLLANVGFLFTNKKPKKQKLQDEGWLYNNIIIPAAKLTKVLKNIKISEDSRDVSIEANYKGIELYFDLNAFYDSKTETTHDYHTFTFYRPWIIGCRYSKDEKEMINYTKKAIELWLKQIDKELDL